MVCLTAIQARYTGFSPKDSEEFNSASRSVKPGLIASGIVSAWTWAATLVRLFHFIFENTTSNSRIYAILLVAIQRSSLQIRHFRAMVVWRWRYCSSSALCSGSLLPTLALICSNTLLV